MADPQLDEFLAAHPRKVGVKAIEEVSQCREMLVSRGDARGFGQLLEVLADMPGSNLRQFTPPCFSTHCRNSFTACR
jgi:hypothetical protein